MTNYRFVQQTLDEEIVGEQFSSCGDDDAALAFASALLAAHAVIEVWRGQRFVGRVVRPSTKHDSLNQAKALNRSHTFRLIATASRRVLAALKGEFQDLARLRRAGLLRFALSRLCRLSPLGGEP